MLSCQSVCFEHDGTCLNKTRHDIHVPYMIVMFGTYVLCSKHGCHVPHMISCSEQDVHVPRQDIHVQNITFMFWTWMSCSEHDIHVKNMNVHVQNMKVMFKHVSSCFCTWKHVLEHENHVQDVHVQGDLNMLWTWGNMIGTCKVYIEHHGTWIWTCHVQ